MGEVFAGDIFITNRCSDSSQPRDHTRSVKHILFYWKQLNGAPTLAQRILFPPQGSVD
jgi:hypothetical protein